MKNFNFLLCLSLCATVASGQVSPKLQTKINQETKEIEPKIIEWRRQFHQYPELSNREFQTGARIAEFLKSLGIEVRYPVAKTGVLGILNGSKPGPVIALRADMDALPITEQNDLPFASKVKSIFSNQETGVMHACGHDAHISMLMAVAQILALNKNELRGTVKFFFQPAEEGAPTGEEAGAFLMIKEGVLENPKVDVVFGLHIESWLPLGTLACRPGPFMAAVDGLNIKVKGKGAHGATPWLGVDPIVVSSQIILGLQTIVSRQTELTKNAAVITIGSFHSGIRRNIIPEEAMLEGTIRTFDTVTQKEIQEKIKRTATKIAESAGTTADVSILTMYPVTFNNIHLTEQMWPSLYRSVGRENVKNIPAQTGAEDFSFFQEKVPGLFFYLGAEPTGILLEKPHLHHTAFFMIDERALVIGVNSMLNLTLDYMFISKK